MHVQSELAGRLRRIWHRCGAKAPGWAACSGASAEPGIIIEGHNQKARAPDARLDGDRLAVPGAPVHAAEAACAQQRPQPQVLER